MPKESAELRDKPLPYKTCPKCKAPFKPIYRGITQRSKKFLFFLQKQDYCACICSKCLNIVGWESPDNYDSK